MYKYDYRQINLTRAKNQSYVAEVCCDSVNEYFEAHYGMENVCEFRDGILSIVDDKDVVNLFFVKIGDIEEDEFYGNSSSDREYSKLKSAQKLRHKLCIKFLDVIGNTKAAYFRSKRLNFLNNDNNSNDR